MFECIISSNQTDDYDCLCELMKNYLSTGTTHTPSRGRGQWNSKKNDRFVDRDDEEPLEAVGFSLFNLNIH
jgi:hypothetical protein